jgi:prepilin-type N-terminal cleavage/methylation domain-containing protein
MLNKLKNSNRKADSGFTIIEVMIVLAIAGLILLIVFLAVPALQRTSRNTQRKNDVSSLLSAANNYTTNNGGTLPTDTTFVADAKTGFYSGDGSSQGNITLVNGAQSAVTPASQTNDRVIIDTNATCSTGGATTAQPRGIAAQYELEVGSGYQTTCQSE